MHAVSVCVDADVSTIEVDNMDSLMNLLDGCCRGRVHQCAVGTIGVDNAIILRKILCCWERREQCILNAEGTCGKCLLVRRCWSEKCILDVDGTCGKWLLMMLLERRTMHVECKE